MTQKERDLLVNLVYKATVVIFDICIILRKSNYSRIATKYLALNCKELSLAIGKAKNFLYYINLEYVPWHVKNYVQLWRWYADIGAFKAASVAASYGLNRVRLAMRIQEQAFPVVDYPDG